MSGPQAASPDQRRSAVSRLVSSLEIAFGNSIVAIGLYGSTGRGADRAYSDIEIFCVLRKTGEKRRLEWTDANGKYEVELFGEDVIRRRAAELDEGWPITHAAYANPKPIRGDPDFFNELRALVFDHSENQFHDVIREIIVGELYEGVGKVRNAISSGTHETLPRVAMRIELMSELMVGLAHRRIYTSTALATIESMALTPRPVGHDELCRLVMSGQLADASRTSEVIEQHWSSVVDWAAARNVDLVPACARPF